MLVVALLVAWLVAVLVTAGLDRVQAFFTPAWLVRLLGLGASVLALTTATSLLAAVCLAGERLGLSVPALCAVLGVAVLLAAWRPVRHGVRMARSRRRAATFRSHGSGGVLLVRDPVPEAFAVPGGAGVVVVTTGLRDALSPTEFSAVLRHEFAHLRFHHHVFVQLVELAASLNPLLRRWCGAVRFAVERHADECAARSGREVASRALAKVAVLSASSRGSTPFGLGIGGDAEAVVRRVMALREPRPPRQRVVPVLAAMLALLVVVVDLDVTADVIQDRIALQPGEVVVFGP